MERSRSDGQTQINPPQPSVWLQVYALFSCGSKMSGLLSMFVLNICLFILKLSLENEEMNNVRMPGDALFVLYTHTLTNTLVWLQIHF